MKFELMTLPYSLDALEPIMSQETLEYHYAKHHKAYVTKLNELIAGTQFESMSLEDIIKNSSGGIFNNAAQIWNHNYFWKSLCTPKTSTPEDAPKLKELIEKNFGTIEEFQNKFKIEALGRFGSGWAWLVQKGETLEIYSSPNAENPLTLGGNVLIGLDLWEHSYYIDYRNDRAAFVDNFWKIINWKQIEDNLSK